MESEATMGDGALGESIGTRRRSHSISDDYSVQKTNDDATECKYAAVKLNYWVDRFIDHFVHDVHRRDPEISLGYWIRVATVTSTVRQFAESTSFNCQIISLGAGFDTLFWRLKDTGVKFRRFVEVDFSSVTSRKIRAIRKPHAPPKFTEFFEENPSENHREDLHAGDYHLLGADLRQLHELDQKLATADLDPAVPTLILSECVLIYMSIDKSTALVRHLASKFANVAFLNYEQVNTGDRFGTVMKDNLSSRGIHLPGLEGCKTLDDQKKRFVDAGFTDVKAWTVSQIYKSPLHAEEVQRVQQIERLDEKELLYQLLDHYSFVYAFKSTDESAAQLADIKIA